MKVLVLVLGEHFGNHPYGVHLLVPVVVEQNLQHWHLLHFTVLVNVIGVVLEHVPDVLRYLQCVPVDFNVGDFLPVGEVARRVAEARRGRSYDGDDVLTFREAS